MVEKLRIWSKNICGESLTNYTTSGGKKQSERGNVGIHLLSTGA